MGSMHIQCDKPPGASHPAFTPVGPVTPPAPCAQGVDAPELVGAAVALLVDLPRVKDPAAQLLMHAPGVVAVVSVVMAAGVLLGAVPWGWAPSPAGRALTGRRRSAPRRGSAG